MKIKAIVLLALAMSGNAWAHEDGHTHWWMELDASFYAGAGLAQNGLEEWFETLDDGSLSGDFDDSDTGMRLFGGVDFGRYVAVELGYADMGEGSVRAQSDGSGFIWNAGPVAQDVEVEGIDLALLGRVPLTDDWTAFGKAGVLSWEVTMAAAGDTQCCGPFAFGQDQDGRGLIYGAGVQYQGFDHLRIVAEYGVAEFSDKGFFFLAEDVKVDSFGISLAYLFQ
jgi:OOP family OmpA-OmpF porin